MVHIPCPLNSAARPRFVSSHSRFCGSQGQLLRLAGETRAKTLLRSMQQYSEILPIDAKPLTNLVFSPIFQKDSLQQLAVPRLHLAEDLPDLLLDFLAN